MSPLAILTVAFSMSADAFAAAVARGIAKQPGWVQALRAGAVFGLIEMLTPLLGWALGKVASGYVASIDHWLAFVLLSIVGGKMVYQGIWGDDAADNAADDDAVAGGQRGDDGRRGLVLLVATAFATSIDAAAIGVTLAFIDANILVVGAAIGAVTFAMTTVGMRIGGRLGARFGGRIEAAGGFGIMLIGLAILLDHLGYIG